MSGGAVVGSRDCRAPTRVSLIAIPPPTPPASQSLGRGVALRSQITLWKRRTLVPLDGRR